MRVRFDQRAVKDMQRIRSYIDAKGSAVSADRVRQHLIKRIDRLRSSPLIGPKSNFPLVRVLAPTRYPYRVYYAIHGETALILHIRHTARAAPKDLK